MAQDQPFASFQISTPKPYERVVFTNKLSIYTSNILSTLYSGFLFFV